MNRIFVETGFPAGIVNVITGSGRTAGEALVPDREIDVVAFTCYNNTSFA